MGQVLSNIIQFAYHNLLRLGHNLLVPPPTPTSTNESNTSSFTALLPTPLSYASGAEDYDLERQSHNLLLPTTQNESRTSSAGALLQTPLSSSSSSYSCSDLSTTGSSIHLSSLDLHGVSNTSSSALHHIALGFHQCLNSNTDSSTTSALHQNSHGDLGTACALQQEILIDLGTACALQQEIHIQCICGEAEDDDLERQSHNLLLPTTQNESRTSSAGALLQTPLSSSSSSYSCSDLSTTGSSVHLSSLDLHGVSNTSSSALHHIALGFHQCLNSNMDSSKTSALHQNSHGDMGTACALQQEILISSESLESLGDSSTSSPLEEVPMVLYSSTDILSNSRTYVPTLDPHFGVDLNIEVVEKKRQAIPVLSHVNSIEPSGKERERERERERKKEKVSKGVVIKERWIKHYSSHQKILLVGEGDFSFSACLAVAFGSANNMIATSLNSQGFLRKNYGKASSNIEKLRSRGCKVTHGVDATEMAKHLLFESMEFDCIIFNFPHAGFLNHESRKSELRRHRKLVREFLANAKKMISKNGEIHISHKSNSFFLEWNVEFLASQAGLRVIEAVDFNLNDYPGYHTKYGFGGDKNFNCNPSKTYKFGLRKNIKNTLYYC
ncbi:uncharacterized protein LOC132308317 [Cornus florida]|uniref:uncharacterized protein LOC132308317 n=1 Tax=Cornus florida TaxID=4283 RepID=UPI00289C823A|nr:uncharacterized protein LOC132308317 [Cornus florida]XP_059662348.1 uncharacterized protein LOC132308317 [Cornus florida]